MRGKVCKLLRKEIYGDLSHRVRTYQRKSHRDQTVTADPLRHAYQQAKKVRIG